MNCVQLIYSTLELESEYLAEPLFGGAADLPAPAPVLREQRRPALLLLLLPRGYFLHS